MEKVSIISSLNDFQSLHKKSELINICCHQSKLLLKSLKRNNRRYDILRSICIRDDCRKHEL